MRRPLLILLTLTTLLSVNLRAGTMAENTSVKSRRFEPLQTPNTVDKRAGAVDPLKAIGRAESALADTARREKLSLDQLVTAYVGQYQRLILEEKWVEAHQSFLKAFRANAGTPDAFTRERNYFELAVLYLLDPLQDEVLRSLRPDEYLQPERLPAFIERGKTEKRPFTYEWFLMLLGREVMRLGNEGETLRVGRIADAFLRLRELLATDYPPAADADSDRLFETARRAALSLSYERLLLRAHDSLLGGAKVELAPFENYPTLSLQVFDHLTPSAKEFILDDTIDVVESLIHQGDTRHAAGLLKFCAQLVDKSGQPFARRDYYQVKISLQRAFVLLQANQFLVSKGLLDLGYSGVGKIADPRDRAEMLGFYHRYRAHFEMLSDNPEAAEREYKESIKAFTDIDNPNLIGGWASLVQFYVFGDDYDRALAAVEQGLAAITRIKAKYPGLVLDSEVARLHLSAVQSYYSKGDHAGLQAALDRASKVVFDSGDRALLEIYRGLLAVESPSGCRDALPKFEAALAKLAETGASSVTEHANLLAGKCHDQMGEPEKALPFLKRAMVINRDIRKQSRGSAAYASHLVVGPFDELERLTHKVLYDGLQKQGFRSDALVNELLYYAEVAKSRGIVDEAETMRIGHAFVDPALPAEVATLLQNIQAARGRPPEVSEENIAAEYTKFVGALGQRHGMKAVLLEYVPIAERDRVVLLVVDDRAVSAVVLKAGWSEIQNRVRELRRGIDRSLDLYTELRKSPEPDAEVVQRLRAVEAALDAESAALGSLLLPDGVTGVGDLSKYVAGKSLVLIPHGALHNLPFAALKVGAGNPPYLIDVVGRLTSAPSSMLLRFIISAYGSNMGAKVDRVLLVGDPNSLSLPTVKDEFEGIRTAFANASLAGKKGDLKPAVQKSPAVHFGAHAFFDQSNPARSGIVLGDGTFTLNEIAMLEDFRTRVVTMGACETGLASVTSGDEVWSVATAFVFSGIPAVVSALWRQDGRAASIFYADFYRTLAGSGDIGSAFRGAMLHVRDRRDDADGVPGLMNSRNPCFWAGFHFIGE